jgi:hypothetical protein
MSLKVILLACIAALTIIYIPIAIAAWSERAASNDPKAQYKSLDWTFGLFLSNASLFNPKGKGLRLYGASIEILVFVLWMFVFFTSN